MSRCSFFWLVQALLACWSLAAGARELDWRSLDVDAQLDDEGRLHVSERHEMVFTGDWNGGERHFRVADDQSLEVESIARLDTDGAWVPLIEGSLEQFDHYQWLRQEHTLRWRVRRDTDVGFDHRVFVHRIDYVLSGALESMGEKRWRLDHDFAFRERPGSIEQFRLRLALDESWHAERSSPLVIERGPLAPGKSVVVELPLVYTGSHLQDPPSTEARAFNDAREWLDDTRRSASGALAKQRRRLLGDARLWVAALFATLLGGLAHALFLRARERGHFAPLGSQGPIDAGWIERHLLALEPEVVGAAYDRVIGSAEVMAVLARLEREGKLGSAVEKHQLALQLLAPKEAFVGYERELVEQLFFAGDHTSTAMIRSHYRSFDPAAVLRRALAPKVDTLLGTTHRELEASPLILKLAACAAGLALMASSFHVLKDWFPSSGGLSQAVLLLGLAAAFLLAAVRARRFRDRLEPPVAEARFLRHWFIAFGAAIVVVALLAPAMTALDLLQHFGSAFTLALLVVWSGWPRGHAAGVALRKRIADARCYFRDQLRSRHPELDDAWYPYLIALGLSPDVDSWFAAHGQEEPAREPRERRSAFGARDSVDSGPSPRSEGAEPARWTGGGGRFGGGGASGSWGSAAAGLAAGVSTAGASGSSSGSAGDRSGSSSSSESTSRSGGGSGGGW